MVAQQPGIIITHILDFCTGAGGFNVLNAPVDFKRMNLCQNRGGQKHDLITDHIDTIKVEKISSSTLYNKPFCIYYGVRYTQTGKPFKSGEKRRVYQENLKKEK